MKSRFFIACLLVPVWLLSACEGDSRAFTEAAEVQTLGLQSISVIAPEGSPEQIVLGTNDQLQLALTGVGAGGEAVSLSAADRDWSSSDPDVAEVNRNGLVSAKSVGSVSFQVDLSGIRSSALDVTVTDAELDTINVSRVDAEADSAPVERCIAQSYRATGEDDDGNARVLNAVQWSVETSSTSDTSDAARVVVSDANNPAIVQLTASEFVTDLTLKATVGEISGTLAVPVSDTLRSISVVPATASLNAGASQQFTATGTYDQAAEQQTDPDSPPAAPPASREIDITTGVSWSVTVGGDFATVDAAGRVSGVTAGSAQIVASCGNVASSAVPVVVQGTADSDGLSFDIVDSPLSLGANNRISMNRGEQVRVRVSTGATYSSDNDVTSEVEWTQNDTVGPFAASLDSSSRSDSVLITSSNEFTGEIEFTAKYRDTEQTLTIDVRL